jgi:hypothetical protein
MGVVTESVIQPHDTPVPPKAIIKKTIVHVIFPILITLDLSER